MKLNKPFWWNLIDWLPDNLPSLLAAGQASTILGKNGTVIIFYPCGSVRLIKNFNQK
jgi:hypothetical protein